MAMNDSVPPFTEVFNTYGERLTNAQLLARYGFLLDGNEHDLLDWSVREMSDVVPFLIRGVRNGLRVRSRSVDEEVHATSEGAFDDDAVNSAIVEKRREKSVNDLVPLEDEAVATASVSARSALSTAPAMNRQSRGNGPGQVVLDRLQEIFVAWPGGESACSDSTLIYIPDCGFARQESKLLAEEYAKEGKRYRYRPDSGPSSIAGFEFSRGAPVEDIAKTYCVSARAIAIPTASFLLHFSTGAKCALRVRSGINANLDVSHSVFASRLLFKICAHFYFILEAKPLRR